MTARLFRHLPDGATPADVQPFSRRLDGQSVMLAGNDFYALACVLILVFVAQLWFGQACARGVSDRAGH